MNRVEDGEGLKLLKLLVVGESVGEPRGAVVTLWEGTRVVVGTNDVVMAPGKRYMRD